MKESCMAHEYERLAEKTEVSYEEAIALKEEIRKRDENGELAADLVHPARWRVITKMNNFEAASFLNAPPLTRPGEGMVTNRSDGKVDVYWWGAI
jgi:hypothetical protein